MTTVLATKTLGRRAIVGPSWQRKGRTSAQTETDAGNIRTPPARTAAFVYGQIDRIRLAEGPSRTLQSVSHRSAPMSAPRPIGAAAGTSRFSVSDFSLGYGGAHDSDDHEHHYAERNHNGRRPDLCPRPRYFRSDESTHGAESLHSRTPAHARHGALGALDLATLNLHSLPVGTTRASAVQAPPSSC